MLGLKKEGSENPLKTPPVPPLKTCSYAWGLDVFKGPALSLAPALDPRAPTGKGDRPGHNAGSLPPPG